MTTTYPATSAAPAEVRALLADRDTLGTTVDRFAAAFPTLSKLLEGAPDISLVDRVRDPVLLTEWPLDDDDSARGTALLAESRLAKEDLTKIRRDYGRLFLGPDRMFAPPYESVYRSGLVLERARMRVRAAYADFGLAGPRPKRDPDDHVALELSFLGTLCVRAMDALEAEDEDALVRTVTAVRSFLDEHLLVWAPDCLGRAAAGSKTLFYQGVAAMGLGALDEARDAFRLLP